MTRALQKQMDDLRTTGKRAALELGAAFVIAAPFKNMLSDAAKLQKEMIGISLAARGSTQDLDQMRAVIEKTAGVTMFSNIDVAKMGKQLATGTGWSRQQVSADLPVFAQFADAQQIMKGTPYAQSVKTAIQLAHLAGYSKPEDIARYTDLLTKASFTIPGGLGEIANSLKYSQNALRQLGLDDDQSVLLNATLNRLGLSGSRGGTTLVAAMTRSIPGIFGSGLLTGKSAEALKAMGMADASGHSTVFTNGKFDALKFIAQLSEYEGQEYAAHPEALARQNILTNLQRAGGVNGARGMELFASPAARVALSSILETLANGAGTAAIQSTFANESVYQQFQNAQTNVTTFMSELGYKLLPAASDALQAFNRQIGALTDWIRDPSHDAAVKTGLYGAAGTAGLLATGGILNGIKWLAKGLGLSRAASAANAASAGGRAGLAGLGLPGVAGVGIIGGGLYSTENRYEGVGARWAAQNPEGFGKFERFMDAVTFGLLKKSDPIEITLNVDGKQMTNVVVDQMSKRLNTPNISTQLFDPQMSYTPAN